MKRVGNVGTMCSRMCDLVIVLTVNRVLILLTCCQWRISSLLNNTMLGLCSITLSPCKSSLVSESDKGQYSTLWNSVGGFVRRYRHSCSVVLSAQPHPMHIFTVSF